MNIAETNEVLKKKLEQVAAGLQLASKAGRGALVSLNEESKRKFKELVQTGESQMDTPPLVEQVKEVLEDLSLKDSAEQLRLAARGLLIKTKDQSSKIFAELVEKGEKCNSNKAA